MLENGWNTLHNALQKTDLILFSSLTNNVGVCRKLMNNNNLWRISFQKAKLWIQADLEKIETPRRSEYRNIPSTKQGKGKSNAQGWKNYWAEIFQKDEMLYQKGGNLTSISINDTYGTCEAWLSLLGHIERESTSSISEVSIRWIQHNGMQKRTPDKDKKKAKKYSKIYE